MTTLEYVVVRTRTGRETHLAAPGSAVTLCGHWLRVVAEAMRVNGAATCARCAESHDANTRGIR